VIHYEEALYQVYAPLPLPLLQAHQLFALWCRSANNFASEQQTLSRPDHHPQHQITL